MVYITAGDLLLYSGDGSLRTIHTGDSAYIPAGVEYAMEAKHVEILETRIY
jgi:quercetin dioxygenase-like cupin family protein